MRLGWTIAELRGRLFFGEADPGRLITDMPYRQDHALPLADERSTGEQLVEIKKLIPVLATRTQLDFKVTPETAAQCAWFAGCASAVERVLALADAVPDQQSDEWGSKWQQFAEGLYQWDADIQDCLTGLSFGESSAYQLGRGLAESSWALNPMSSEGTVSSWSYLLGTERCVLITRLIERIAPTLPPLNTQAIKGSLAAWQRVASDPAWRDQTDAAAIFRQQIMVWRDLLLTDADPRQLERPPATLQRIASIFPILRTLWLQIATGILGVAFLAVGAWLISKYGSTSGPWGQLVAGLGLIGITGSGLSSRAKLSANSLAKSLQAAIEADDVVHSVTLLPLKPKQSTVKDPGKFATPGTLAEPVTLTDLEESRDARGPAAEKVWGWSERREADRRAVVVHNGSDESIFDCSVWLVTPLQGARDSNGLPPTDRRTAFTKTIPPHAEFKYIIERLRGSAPKRKPPVETVFRDAKKQWWWRTESGELRQLTPDQGSAFTA